MRLFDRRKWRVPILSINQEDAGKTLCSVVVTSTRSSQCFLIDFMLVFFISVQPLFVEDGLFRYYQLIYFGCALKQSTLPVLIKGVLNLSLHTMSVSSCNTTQDLQTVSWSVAVPLTALWSHHVWKGDFWFFQVLIAVKAVNVESDQ